MARPDGPAIGNTQAEISIPFERNEANGAEFKATAMAKAAEVRDCTNGYDLGLHAPDYWTSFK